MKGRYSISEFYLLLKLGIFRGGKVDGLGSVSCSDANTAFLRKPLAEYQRKVYFKKQLGTGLYLLDLYPLEKRDNRGAHIMVVCRTTLSYKEKIYVLKLTGTSNVSDIKATVENGTSARKRKPVFGRKKRKSTFDSSPLNSVRRKY